MINRCRGRKIKLQGFNSLTKSLSFNIYDICYARSKASQNDYLDYIDEVYNSKKIRSILEEVTRIIEANIINMSSQDYEPRGASVTVLINEGPLSRFTKTARSRTLTRAIFRRTPTPRRTRSPAFQRSAWTSTLPPAA